ncbi:hypothetical protein [Flavobacterium sp. JAS]|uniref:hypothetical protein n=1 Tax=Flavobacterium sp. JAS TaxID=2897329 RepID=UPI001E38D238|nr:hypothetical protein [Flavobacterium sp. JAS]MCD0472499.1 hypothetical protein [Flavobacterium sp. JAS]
MMNSIYPLEWLDILILETFNSKKANIQLLSERDLSLISENVLIESQKVQLQLKKEFFSLHKKSEIRLLVRKYHSTIIFLLDTIIESQQDEMFKSDSISKIITTIISSLDEMLSFVENRYSNYLSLDERVPVTCLIVYRKELSLKLNKLKNRKFIDNSDIRIIAIIVDVLSKKIQSNTGRKITYRQIFYLKDLLKKLDTVSDSGERSNFNSGLHELLIAQNFNCPIYINYYIDQIIADTSTQGNSNDKLNRLLFHYKEFSQLISNEKVTFDPSQHNIKYVLNNWFKHEIGYLERRIDLSFEDKEIFKSADFSVSVLKDNKVECILSTDQMALVIRAADESRIIKAKSMNYIFKTIVPHLSTPQKKDLSYDAMRSKSYVAEERDKEIAIKALERMIKHIKGF